MAAKSFRSLFEDVKEHEDYRVELAILEVTEEVARCMDELDISRAELARRLGTSPAYVTKILRGDANLSEQRCEGGSIGPVGPQFDHSLEAHRLLHAVMLLRNFSLLASPARL